MPFVHVVGSVLICSSENGGVAEWWRSFGTHVQTLIVGLYPRQVGIELTEQKEAELRAAFDLLDIDSDGSLTTSELPGLLAAMDIEASMAKQVHH